VGVWGWGFWAWPPTPNPQSPIPNPQSPIPFFIYFIFNYIKNLKINNKK